MTATSVFSTRLQTIALRDIVLDYIVMLTSSGVSDSPTEEKLKSARKVLEGLGYHE